MNKLILCFFFSLFPLLVQADIQVDINPSTVNAGDSFQLILIQNGTAGGGIPDLSGLQKDFAILGTERQMSYSVINGQSTASNQWIVTLKALNTGVLSIPAITIGAEHSTPMTINVNAATPQANEPALDQQQDILLTTQLDRTSTYVNQQIIYTVKLYNSKRLLDADYQAPQAENALIIPLGDAKRYQTIQNNVNYVVEEQHYAVYPQKSGTLKIQSPTFAALVYGFDPQRVSVHDKEQSLKVLPIPKQYQGSVWLPAKQVRLSEQYENNSNSLSQGGTLIRTVTLEGVAVPAQLLPELHFSAGDNFNVYPEKGTERNQVQQGELVGRTEFKITYLFNKPGTVVIPEVQLHWFNTETAKDELTVLPSRSIEVLPAAPDLNNKALNPPAVQGQDSMKHTEEDASSSSGFAAESLPWPLFFAVFFACAWAITLILWFRPKRSSRVRGKKQDKAALALLKKACNEGNPKKARDALLKWASSHWPDASVLNLNDLMLLVTDTALNKQLHLLSEALYKDQGGSGWRGDELWRAVNASKPVKQREKTPIQILPPMNPR